MDFRVLVLFIYVAIIAGCVTVERSVAEKPEAAESASPSEATIGETNAVAPNAEPATPSKPLGSTIASQSSQASPTASHATSAPATGKTPPKPNASVAEKAQPKPKPNGSPVAAAKPPGKPLDIAALKERLRDTPAIGVFTKLTLKNQMDDLLNQFRTYHQRGQRASIASLRQPYDMLVLKVLALLQDSDPSLARTISESREDLWGILADPDKFKSAS